MPDHYKHSKKKIRTDPKVGIAPEGWFPTKLTRAQKREYVENHKNRKWADVNRWVDGSPRNPMPEIINQNEGDKPGGNWRRKKIRKSLFGVKKYSTKCDSVKDMIRILNTHPAYEEFRNEREKQLDKGNWDYRKLLNGITAWSTNPKYIDLIWSTIVDNNLP